MKYVLPESFQIILISKIYCFKKIYLKNSHFTLIYCNSLFNFFFPPTHVLSPLFLPQKNYSKTIKHFSTLEQKERLLLQKASVLPSLSFSSMNVDGMGREGDVFSSGFQSCKASIRDAARIFWWVGDFLMGQFFNQLGFGFFNFYIIFVL